MSTQAIRKALETRLAALPAVPPIAWENTNFKPPATVFLTAFVLFAEPDDMGYRNSPYIQRGYMQIGMHFPSNVGTEAAHLLGEQLRSWFERGTSLVVDDIITIIDRTPEITAGDIEDSRYVQRVRVRFFAQVDPVTA